MGTTSEKLTYLNTTKEKIKDSINLTGANIGTSDTFRSYASKLKKGYIDIINNGIDTLYNNFPKVSGIGSNLSLAPTYEAPIKLNEIQGDTLQDGTPTPDTPVPIQSVTGLQNINITGKNLLPINQIQSQTINGLTITNLGDGTIKVNGTANTTTRLDVTYTKPLKANTPYIFSNANIRASSNANINIQDSDNNVLGIITLNVATNTYTPTTDVTIAKMRFYIDSGQSFDNYILKVQLEQGSTATEYEPYKSNTYEVNLGKNLLNIPDGTYSNNGITAVSSNGIITLNGTATNTSFIVITLLKEIVAANQTLTISNNNQENISDNLTEMRLVTTVGDYIPCSFKQINNSTTRTNLTGTYNRLQIRTSSGVSFNNFIIKPQLEKGTQPTSYSPYFTPIELNKIGDYKDSIKKSTGKNLFDKNNVSIISRAYINSSTGEIVSGGTSSVINNISVISDTTYTLTAVGKNKIAFYDSNNNYLSNITSNLTTFTTPANCKYIKIQLATETLDINTIQLEIGSTATTYEPYGKVWYVEKNIGKVVLNGNEAWGYDSNSLFFVSSNAISNYSRSNNIPYCDYYKGVSNVNAGGNINNNEIAFNNNVSNNRLYVKNTNITSASDFKTWLSTHNTEVLYVLATPEYTEITNTELIEDLETLYTAKSQEGTTNISITSEDLEMILNVSALKGDA